MEALRLARSSRPDLILMDIQPARGIGAGGDEMDQGGRRPEAIPVIAVTAFAMKGDEEKIREGGCEAYIAKPISVAHFLATVQNSSLAPGP